MISAVIILLAAFLVWFLFFRNRKPKSGVSLDEIMISGADRKTPPALSAEQVRRISIIQKALIAVNDTSLEDTLDNFSRDAHPDREIEIWEAIAGAYQQALKQRPTASQDEKMEVYKLLLLRSSMSSEEVLAQYELGVISEASAREVLDLYGVAGKPILVVGG